MSGISFQNLLNTLLDENTHLHPQYLYRLSDLEPSEIAQFGETWKKLPLGRRQALMENLEELGYSDSLVSFEAIGRQVIDDEDPKVRMLAIRILSEYELSDLIAKYLHLLQSDSDQSVRSEAASALGRFVYLGEIDELPAELLHTIEDSLLDTIHSDKASAVRRHALEAVSFSSRDEVQTLIEKAFISGDTEWMCTALASMGRSADRRWGGKIITMLEDTVPAIREEAARAAGELEIADAVPVLLELIDDVSERVRDAAIWSLSQIGGEGVRETLEELLDEAEDVRDIELLEDALDNLSFTEDFQLFSLLDFQGEDFASSMYEFLKEDEEFQEEMELNDDDEEFQA